MAVYVVGWEQFIAVGQRLEHAQVMEPIRRAIQDAAKGLEADVKRSAQAILPHAGHLGDEIARSTTITAAPTEGGVRLTAESPHQIDNIDQGIVHHPLFGNKAHWYEEAVTPGWFSNPTRLSEPKFTDAVQRAMEEVKQEIEGG